MLEDYRTTTFISVGNFTQTESYYVFCFINSFQGPSKLKHISNNVAFGTFSQFLCLIFYINGFACNYVYISLVYLGSMKARRGCWILGTRAIVLRHHVVARNWSWQSPLEVHLILNHLSSLVTRFFHSTMFPLFKNVIAWINTSFLFNAE